MPNTKREETLQAFKEAWQFEQLGKRLEDIKPKSDNIFHPWPMNLAFSLELYLKCLFAIEQGHWLTKQELSRKEWHDLLELYKIQTAESQKAIEDIYKDNLSTQPPAFRRPLELVLGESKDVFENWRYAFQKTTNSSFGTNVGIVCTAIRKRIIQLRPDWEEYLHNDFT